MHTCVYVCVYTRTSIAVVEIRKLLPLVVLHQADQGASDVGPHLQHELVEAISGETRRDEGHVQRLAERRDGVHRLLVVETEDGVDAPGKLRAD